MTLTPLAASAIPTPSRYAPQSVYGLRDRNGDSDLPSRPCSAVDEWGKRPDLLLLGRTSESEMMVAGKMVSRAPRVRTPSPPRLSAAEELEVDRYVLAYENRTKTSLHHETPSATYRRLLKDLPTLPKTALRDELKKRGAYKRNLSTPELRHRLTVVYTQETRQSRLREAHEDKDQKAITQINREANSFSVLRMPPSVPLRRCAMEQIGVPRSVFISISSLQRTWRTLSPQMLNSCLVVVDIEKAWLKANLPGQPTPVLRGGGFDNRYIYCDKDFLDMLTFKEESLTVHYFRPQKSFSNLSTWLSKLQDPMSPVHASYSPLQLSDHWWWRISQSPSWSGQPYYGPRKPEPRFCREIKKIVSNFKNSSFEMSCVAELLVQSNPSLDIQPWFEVERLEDAMSKSKSSSKRGTTIQRRKAKEKERLEEIRKVEKDLERLESEVEIGEVAAAVQVQALVRGNISRGGTRMERTINVEHEGGGGIADGTTVL